MNEDNKEPEIKQEVLKESKVAGGRIAVYIPDHPRANNRGYVPKARWLMEQKLGRLLDRNEEVHHIDGNKTNDVIENLEIKSKSEHTKHHWKDDNGKLAVSIRKLDYEWIASLLMEGYGYKKIAKITGYNIDSTQSACRKIRLGHF